MCKLFIYTRDISTHGITAQVVSLQALTISMWKIHGAWEVPRAQGSLHWTQHLRLFQETAGRSKLKVTNGEFDGICMPKGARRSISRRHIVPGLPRSIYFSIDLWIAAPYYGFISIIDLVPLGPRWATLLHVFSSIQSSTAHAVLWSDQSRSAKLPNHMVKQPQA